VEKLDDWVLPYSSEEEFFRPSDSSSTLDTLPRGCSPTVTAQHTTNWYASDATQIKSKKNVGICIAPTQLYWAALGSESCELHPVKKTPLLVHNGLISSKVIYTLKWGHLWDRDTCSLSPNTRKSPL
jgi:hypothetical protein